MRNLHRRQTCDCCGGSADIVGPQAPVVDGRPRCPYAHVGDHGRCLTHGVDLVFGRSGGAWQDADGRDHSGHYLWGWPAVPCWLVVTRPDRREG